MSVRSWFSVCALCALCGESSYAASPHVAAIAPRGAKQGTDLTLTFTGTNLGDAQEVFAYGPGITVGQPEVVSPTQVKVKATVAADCRPGEHAFRVRTATGVSDLRTFWVGLLPTADEAEPNNEFDKPQLVSLNTTIHGGIGGEDQDFFAVECKKGQRLAVEIEAMRLGGGMFDPYVAILDAKRFELATSDDHPRLGQDGACAIKVPEDGRYVIQVRESAYGAGNAYRLHVGTFPAPAAVTPAGGRPGEELEVRFLGDPLGEIKQKVKLPAEADPDYRLFCKTADGVGPTGFKFRVVDLPSTTGTEANVSHAAAVAGPVPGAFNGVVDKPMASKVFKFKATKGQTFDVQCYARRIGSPLDPVMHVGTADGKSLASNDDSGGPDSLLQFTAPADGEYSVWVHDHLNKAGPSYVFRIEISPSRPAVVLTIPKADGNNPQNQDRQAVAVPKGNRFAALVNLGRKDVGGPLTVGFDGLPAGVTATAEPADPGQTAVPVVFEASKDAAVGGRLGAFTAVDPKGAPAPARTLSDAVLCVGQNQTVYHRNEADRVAAAVTEAAPFRIEVVEPKAPVVQNGSLNLKVKAERADGFKGPIAVVPLWGAAGHGHPGVGDHPGRIDGSRADDERGRQCFAEEVEDGPARPGGHRGRAGVGVERTVRGRGGPAAGDAGGGPRRRRAREAGRRGLSGDGGRAVRRRGDGEAARPAGEGDRPGPEADEGREGTDVRGGDRPGHAGRQAQGVLPGGADGERRRGGVEYRRGRATGGRPAAGEAGRRVESGCVEAGRPGEAGEPAGAVAARARGEGEGREEVTPAW